MYHITMESFGADCPRNWEEIAAFLNRLIDEKLEAADGAFDPGHDDSGLSEEGHEIVDKIWEDYCTYDIPGAPEPIFD